MRPQQRDITDFLTDGSLAGLCAAAQTITGVPIALRAANGNPVAGEAPDPHSSDVFSAPLRINTGDIGSLVVPAHSSNDKKQTAEEIQRFLTLLASVVGEICDRDVELHEHLDELGALYKLSSILVGVTDIDKILSAGIEMAVTVLGVDAGAIRLLSRSGRKLKLAVSKGLSEQYAKHTTVIYTDMAADTSALEGGVVLFEDILRDGKPTHPEAMEAEGLQSMISAGLIFHGETLGVLRLFTREQRTFNGTEQHIILSIAQQLAAACASARLIEAEAKSAEINKQVRQARAVQRRMMPDERVESKNLDIAARYLSSSHLGGDFFDIFDSAQGQTFIVGDVVGKGIAAAMLMSSLRATIRTLSDTDLPIESIIAQTNRALARDTQTNEFATVFAGVIDPDANTLRYISAGHEPTLLVRARNNPPSPDDIIELREGGMLIGVDADQTYEPGTIELKPGDTLLAYSDGLTEAMNYEKHLYTRGRIKQALATVLTEDPDASAERIADQTLWSMRCFTGVRPQSDDVTLIVVRIR